MNRLTVVAVAAVVALGSGFGLMQYVGGAEERATAAASPVPILVAMTDVPEGTDFAAAWADGSIVQSETMEAIRPPTAILDPAALEGTVTTGMLRAGQVVVEGVFAPPEETERVGPPTFADDLPEGSVAVSFEASGASAVGELISPGDHVNLLVQVPNAAELGLPDSGGPAIVHVFQNLKVLAIGASRLPSEPLAADDPAAAVPAPSGGGTYTVAVAPQDAARILLLTRQYEVLLALVGPGTEPGPQAAIGKPDALPDTLTADDALPQEADS
jgi:pilus assembly protein CpaB